MTMSVVEYRPPTKVDIPTSPVIFLAGPIQGAPDWQSRAVHQISSFKDNDFWLCNPRRSEGTDKSKFDYYEQVSWELDQLTKARDYGAVIFWFAKQDPKVEYPAGRAYAQTTRFEMGLACGWKDYNPSIAISVGIEDGYVGGNEKYIKHLASRADVEVLASLGAVCLDASQKAQNRRVTYGQF